jgi:hypothetical protein
MYTRKPKDLTKFLVNITSAQALHTWEYADKTRLGQMGSSALLSASARKKREANRKTIGEYRTSQIATQANKMRRDVTEFTQNERQKVRSRLERNQPPNPAKTLPAARLNERPTPDASLYRRPSA